MFSTNTFFADLVRKLQNSDGNMFWRFDNFFVKGNKKKMAKFCWDKRWYVVISTSFCFYCLRTARATSGESKRSDSIRADRERSSLSFLEYLKILNKFLLPQAEEF